MCSTVTVFPTYLDFFGHAIIVDVCHVCLAGAGVDVEVSRALADLQRHLVGGVVEDGDGLGIDFRVLHQEEVQRSADGRLNVFLGRKRGRILITMIRFQIQDVQRPRKKKFISSNGPEKDMVGRSIIFFWGNNFFVQK